MIKHPNLPKIEIQQMVDDGQIEDPLLKKLSNQGKVFELTS